ncbi:MAG: CoB--CoM heterodisulfide reductase iron-sulfur subunit A family protein, partial [Euryarchaeota archaeon]|nr:CoB--CoM heterodisulfide reductase iron-sulfur subunit A family protein [Euryarchaeota archaeon]
AKKIPGVVHADHHIFLCSDPGRDMVREAIKKYKLDRVVTSHCTPTLHEETFHGITAEAGLNPFFHEVANVREHCSWPHYKDPEKATEKAKHLVAAAVEKVKKSEPIEKMKVKVVPSTLVIGGGPAGIQASLDLANAGYKVYLIDKLPHLGGNMARLGKVFPTDDCPLCILGKKFNELRKAPNLQILAYTEVQEVTGRAGEYKVKLVRKPRYIDEKKCTSCGDCVKVCPVTLPDEFEQGIGVRKTVYLAYPQAIPQVYTIDKDHCINCGMCEVVCDPKAIDFNQKPEEIEITVGTIIVAIGYEEWDPKAKEEFGYGRYENVITQLQLARMLDPEGPSHGRPFRPSDGPEGSLPRRIVFIQCVGSRDINHFQYCSKICCMFSLKHAKMIFVDIDPKIEIYMCYMDIRAFSKGYEEYYKDVQERGLKLVRGRVAQVLENPKNRNLIVKVEDTFLGKTIKVEADLVVLASALVPINGTQKLAEKLRIALGEDGFLKELHPKVSPVDSSLTGIYIAGACAGPKDIPEAVEQGSAAAARAMSLMGKGEIEVTLTIAKIGEDICIGCGICEQMCPYSAIKLIETFKGKKARVFEAECRGCGTCCGSCPTGALQRSNFTVDQIFAQIEGIMADYEKGEKVSTESTNQ